MPSRPRPGNDKLASSGGIGHALEHRKATKQYQTSRFAKEKPLSPRAGQSLKFKEKVKAENPIRPPHADLPLKFVKNESSGFIVQAEFPGDVHQSQLRKCPSEEEELVKYMSKVPGYLLRGEKPLDNVLNFGVLDWGRLEKWRHKQSKLTANEKISGDCSTATDASSISSVIHTEVLAHQREHSSCSGLNTFRIVDASPVVRPLNRKEINHPHLATSFNSFSDEKQEIQRKAKPLLRHGHDLKSSAGKAKQSDQGSSFMKETSPSDQSNLDYKVSHNSKKKVSIRDGEPENCAEKFKGLRLENSAQHWSGKQENIVLLLPKDFSRPGSLEIPQRVSLDGKSAEFGWGSFSDIFSVDEIQSEELFSDVQYSCPLNCTFETERELDLKLDSLVKAQGVELPVDSPPTPLCSNKNNNFKAKTSASTNSKASGDLIERAPPSLAEMSIDASAPRRFSFSELRLGRSLSYKEGSAHSQLMSAYVSAKSGPAKPESSADCETPVSNMVNVGGRTRNSPLRRLLDPLLKHRALNKTKELPNDLGMNPPTAVEIPSCEECEKSTVKAFLHLTVTGGLPLFKFMVETNNEILASTVKILSTFGKDDSRSLYTFYSVNKIRKKSAGWKNHKAKPSGYSYNVIGQMKVSNPKLPSWCDKTSDEQYLVKESILYGLDLGKENTLTSEFMTSRELAAIVVKMPKETAKNVYGSSECFSNDTFSISAEDEMSGHTVVILPGGIHSLPHEGVPSPLINRWRTGGSCDCGGWDVGCKLRILATQDDKALINSRPSPMQVRCDLFEKGESKGEPFFRLIPFQEGIFSVEFDAKMSALQGFSICVAIINSQISNNSSDWEFDTAKAPMVARGKGPDKHAPHPPLSPVGRV